MLFFPALKVFMADFDRTAHVPNDVSPTAGAHHWLTALPVYNEVAYVDDVLDQVLRHSDRILVVDDGSTDGTAAKLDARQAALPDRIDVIHHPQNRGYGAGLQSAFAYTLQHGYAGIVTLDCDGQHQPHRIPSFIEAAKSADIVSGSRYLEKFEGDDEPPAERMGINRRITAEINERLGFELTDAFCGFKAYRAEALRAMTITDNGYAMPLELWVQAAAAGLRVIELPVPLIYLDLERSFGGSLDQAEIRLKYYNEVLEQAIEAVRESREGR
ncbi:Undecaprenyl-phosphate mannosyltransferase [Allorhodopirellula heiligendammensis]|uniref:Undecaprenyl-phosphate mannosyltransferase n=2 Tax=Allorhodopirellula heiligendammensis TaxID=2714739 RepID=A0A5C6BXJ1_9BACT|nr:Undecaprenyl-phosphate mannosyltransferase [Allorhodopirellula heiligendammensis]